MRWIVAVICVLSAGCTGFGSNLDTILRSGQGLDEQTVAAGLKEALHVGTERTVTRTSKLDGFFGNALIRILMPEQFESAAGTLRSLGFAKQVDNFEMSMNRAAELAAGEATDIFWTAISRITIADAMGILEGNETAATDYFRSRTETTLRQRFTPIVQAKMSEIGLYRTYNELADYYDDLPFTTKPALDLDEYITEHALNGLFTVLGQEEKRIREDPVARTTELLKRVFGNKS